VAHAVEHLSHRIHAHFAALEAIEREFDGEVFREAQQRGLVHFRGWGSSCDAGKRLAQRDLRVGRQGRHALLPDVWILLGSFRVLCLAELHKQPQQALQIGFFKFGNRSLIRNRSSGDIASSEHSASAGACSAGNRSGANCRADSAANAAASSRTTYPGADRPRTANGCAASTCTARSCCVCPFT